MDGRRWAARIKAQPRSMARTTTAHSWASTAPWLPARRRGPQLPPRPLPSPLPQHSQLPPQLRLHRHLLQGLLHTWPLPSASPAYLLVSPRHVQMNTDLCRARWHRCVGCHLRLPIGPAPRHGLLKSLCRQTRTMSPRPQQGHRDSLSVQPSPAECVSHVRCRGQQKKNLTEEERESQAQTLYSEFLSAHDHGEALTLARELAAPGTCSFAPMQLNRVCRTIVAMS